MSKSPAVPALFEAIIGAAIILAFAAGAIVYSVPRAEAGERVCGTASYYGYESGNRTATGERFNPNGLSAAMPSRKHLGEHWRVTYRGKSVVVRVNDVGPAKRLHRVIDLSKGAASHIGLIRAGTGRVCLERL